MATINIKDAYRHIPMFQPHQRYLHFQFLALPFDVATAPHVFTKVLAQGIPVPKGSRQQVELPDLATLIEASSRKLKENTWKIVLTALFID